MATSSGAPFGQYEIQLATDAAFTAPVSNYVIGDSSNTQYTAGAALVNGTTYWWRVRSWNTIPQYSGWSASRTVRIPFAPPALAFPGDTSVGVARRPTFTWAAVPGVTSYRIQASTSPSFTSLLVNATTASTSYTPGINLPANTTIYWHVQASAGAYAPGFYQAAPFSFTTGP